MNSKKTETISTDATANALVARVGKRIADAADCPNFSWEFLVFRNPEANAFCLPGGKVGVYTGILSSMSCEAELAGVIGHEVGHAIARHGGERMTQSLLQSIGAALLSETTRNEQILQAYGVVSNLGVILPYSRKHEHEADTLGLILMAKAGYDPSSLIAFWRNFSKTGGSSGSFLEKFLSTHPLDSERISAMEKQLPEAMQYYNRAKNKYGHRGIALLPIRTCANSKKKRSPAKTGDRYHSFPVRKSGLRQSSISPGNKADANSCRKES